MSGIDTGRVDQRINPLPVQAGERPRIARRRLPPVNPAQNRPEVADRADTLPKAQPVQSAVPVHGPDSADFDALRFVRSDWLIADLARIDQAISAATETAPEAARPALQVGSQAVREQLRRLLLVQQSTDRVIM